MESLTPATIVSCSQCGGDLHPDAGQIFLTCPYCGSTVFLDKSQVVFHWYVAPTLDETRARGALARWMAGNQTVKDLDRKARVTEVTFSYFPMWLFKRRLPSGEDRLLLMPAAATSISELKRIHLPPGDLRRSTPEIDRTAQPPTVPLEAALNWLSQSKIPLQEIVEKSLVHIPIYTCKYFFNDRTYTAIVEGASGEVFANIYPAKAEAPYLAIGGITAILYLCLATFPAMGALQGGAAGLGIGFLICGAAGLVIAPILFAIAAWIAAKI
ncbi:MAG: hypothetical protein NZ840_10655 [Anaerolineales bacterium]|nr:hypothetical protein [Anaerolineales bacterium]MDW8162500.1 hypothetical protein [Anaerolineales bacterium]